jgi:hypothetical protein
MTNKLRVWNTKLLNDIYAISTQLRASIENISKQTGIMNLAVLPPSTIPTSTLYELVACYEVLYNRLLEEDLLKTGNIKQTKGLH